MITPPPVVVDVVAAPRVVVDDVGADDAGSTLEEEAPVADGEDGDVGVALVDVTALLAVVW